MAEQAGPSLLLTTLCEFSADNCWEQLKFLSLGRPIPLYEVRFLFDRSNPIASQRTLMFCFKNAFYYLVNMPNCVNNINVNCEAVEHIFFACENGTNRVIHGDCLVSLSPWPTLSFIRITVLLTVVLTAQSSHKQWVNGDVTAFKVVSFHSTYLLPMPNHSVHDVVENIWFSAQENASHFSLEICDGVKALASQLSLQFGEKSEITRCNVW